MVMKVAIVYDSLTGNTKKLVDVILECFTDDVMVYKEYTDDILGADLIFVGSWTFRGGPSEKIKKVYNNIENKKIFVFGTCGFGGSADYYARIFENTCKYINKNNEILDYYFCPGKMPLHIKEKYEQMLKENPTDMNIIKQIENFDAVLTRPDSGDLNLLKSKVMKVINESFS